MRCIGPDVAVLALWRPETGFDARRDALARSYRYRVLHTRIRSPFEAGRALWWPHRLDRDLLHACAALLPGTHDFTAFTPTDTYHTRFDRDVVVGALGRGRRLTSPSRSRRTRSCAT